MTVNTSPGALVAVKRGIQGLEPRREPATVIRHVSKGGTPSLLVEFADGTRRYVPTHAVKAVSDE